jgi:hypothetical protein
MVYNGAASGTRDAMARTLEAQGMTLNGFSTILGMLPCASGGNNQKKTWFHQQACPNKRLPIF